MTAVALDPPLPRAVQVEVTAACNLRCRMCLVRYRAPRGRVEGSLTFEQFVRIVDAVPGLEEVTLQGLGEPLLAPDFLRMVAYASTRGMRVGFNTNGTLLTPARVAALIALRPAWIHVSLDGATAATYEGIRDGAVFDDVAVNVGALVVAVREAAAPIELSLVCVLMRRNLHDLPALVRLAAAWGVPRVWAQNLSHDFSDVGDDAGFAAIRAFAVEEALWLDEAAEPPAFAEARALGEALGVEVRLPRVATRPTQRAAGTPACDWPWRSAYVRRDGRVQPCCMLMGDARAELGDLATDDFATIWAGAPYRRFRAALCEDAPPAVCAGCASWRGVF